MSLVHVLEVLFDINRDEGTGAIAAFLQLFQLTASPLVSPVQNVKHLPR